MKRVSRWDPTTGRLLAPVDPWERIKEIDLFFAERGPEHQTMRRLVRRLRTAGISYAVLGGMAVDLHGAHQTTNDVDVLLTVKGFERFCKVYVGKTYDPVPGRPRRFVERQSGVTVDVVISGRYPGSGKPGPIAFPEPDAASEEIKKTRVVTLVQLIELKLAASRFRDFGAVVFLMQTHNLDESFANKLHPSVRQEYIQCLEEKRREDDYLAREG
jgi:hypothetical protein